MRRLPNDTITVTLPDGQSITVPGDPAFPAGAWGGNDTLTAAISGLDSHVTLVGEDLVAMHGNSQGGNDSLVVSVDGGRDGAVLVGDAQSMFGNAKGGNDTLHVDAHYAFYTTVSLYGDVQGDMSGNTEGGDDSLTASTGWRSYGSLSGDAGGAMTGNAHGGNDTLSATHYGLEGGQRLSGDAAGPMTDNAVGGNDNLTFTATADTQVGSGNLSGDSGTSMSDGTRGGDDILTAIVNGEPAALSASLVGDAPTMSGSAHGGNDMLNGASTPDRLWGDAMSYAPSAPGSITGGKDVLNGGGGNDWLSGGPNNDTFVFDTGSGADVIKDFDQGNLAVGSTTAEHDVINLEAYGFTDWTTLSSLISDDSSGDAVIHLTANDTITLDGVRTADLQSTDFIV
jgi:hypothetical protein